MLAERAERCEESQAVRDARRFGAAAAGEMGCLLHATLPQRDSEGVDLFLTLYARILV